MVYRILFLTLIYDVGCCKYSITGWEGFSEPHYQVYKYEVPDSTVSSLALLWILQFILILQHERFCGTPNMQTLSDCCCVSLHLCFVASTSYLLIHIIYETATYHCFVILVKLCLRYKIYLVSGTRFILSDFLKRNITSL